jgi:hypothetical protein
MLNEHLQKHINKEGFTLVSSVVESKKTSSVKSELSGSLKERPVRDWSSKLVDVPMIETEDSITGEIGSIRKIFSDRSLTLDVKSHETIKRIVSTIYKEKTINAKVDSDYIQNIIVNWVFFTFENKKADKELSTFIIDEVNRSIEKLRVYFRVINLEIDKPFSIGEVEFIFFTKDFFDKLEDRKKELGFDKLRDKYQGQVFASYIVEAEPDKAQEIAYVKCALAVDILKIFSVTTHFPLYKLIFDIDKRIGFNPEFNQIIVEGLQSENDFRVNLQSSRNGQLPYSLNANQLQIMETNGLSLFSNFIRSEPSSELKLLINNSIVNYANSLSENNLWKRIVNLFSILESLLLKDENNPIQESISLYLPKLITNDFNHRRKIRQVIKKLYSVRSQMIHHFKQTKFEMEDLTHLQISILILIRTLIHKSNTHLTKQSILIDIDEAILQAYQT